MTIQLQEWTETRLCLPREGEVVLTHVNDGRGIRNETPLKYKRGLWFFPDESVYVYYTPTHWKQL